MDANARSTVSTVFAMDWLLSRLHSSAVCLSLSLFWSFFSRIFFRSFCFCICICIICLEDDFAVCQYMNQCGSVGEYYWCVFFLLNSPYCRCFADSIATLQTNIHINYIYTYEYMQYLENVVYIEPEKLSYSIKIRGFSFRTVATSSVCQIKESKKIGSSRDNPINKCTKKILFDSLSDEKIQLKRKLLLKYHDMTPVLLFTTRLQIASMHLNLIHFFCTVFFLWIHLD